MPTVKCQMTFPREWNTKNKTRKEMNPEKYGFRRIIALMRTTADMFYDRRYQSLNRVID